MLNLYLLQTKSFKVRRSLGVNPLSSAVQFRPTSAGYIYGRY
ncbi:hypothetical protein [Chroococcidiopsis sp. TS-821]|nr:hypothetical protein [Chroococcidiopsis sp. TS-821]